MSVLSSPRPQTARSSELIALLTFDKLRHRPTDRPTLLMDITGRNNCLVLALIIGNNKWARPFRLLLLLPRSPRSRTLRRGRAPMARRRLLRCALSGSLELTCANPRARRAQVSSCAATANRTQRRQRCRVVENCIALLLGPTCSRSSRMCAVCLPERSLRAAVSK